LTQGFPGVLACLSVIGLHESCRRTAAVTSHRVWSHRVCSRRWRCCRSWWRRCWGTARLSAAGSHSGHDQHQDSWRPSTLEDPSHCCSSPVSSPSALPGRDAPTNPHWWANLLLWTTTVPQVLESFREFRERSF